RPRNARIGCRRRDVGEAHRPQLAVREAVRAALDPWLHQTRDGVRHEAVLVDALDRKSTRLNSSHRTISYAVFCLKKKKKTIKIDTLPKVFFNASQSWTLFSCSFLLPY